MEEDIIRYDEASLLIFSNNEDKNLFCLHLGYVLDLKIQVKDSIFFVLAFVL